MKILALQLKRIGDLILTTPALSALRQTIPEAKITLVVADACGGLLPAIEEIDAPLAFRRGRLNLGLLKSIFSQRFDACLDFTGNDRSAFLTLLSGARRKLTFERVKKSKLRSLAYNEFIASSVRERHTIDHYGDLASALPEASEREKFARAALAPRLALPSSLQETARALTGPQDYVAIHPGTARADKYWKPERWAQVITHLQQTYGLECILTGGSDPLELAHLAEIQRALPHPIRSFAGKTDLLTFAAILQRAKACLSCDTAAVHFASAFEKPQLVLYGPINPYQWRPRHPRAIILSAAHPATPLTDFQPRMKSAPMDAISTEAVIRATDCLLAMSPFAAEPGGKPD